MLAVFKKEESFQTLFSWKQQRPLTTGMRLLLPLLVSSSAKGRVTTTLLELHVDDFWPKKMRQTRALRGPACRFFLVVSARWLGDLMMDFHSKWILPSISTWVSSVNTGATKNPSRERRSSFSSPVSFLFSRQIITIFVCLSLRIKVWVFLWG